MAVGSGWISRMTVGRRLTMGFGIVLLLCAVAIGVSLQALSQVAHSTRNMMSEPLAKERAVQEWARNIAVAVRRTAALAMSNDERLEAYFLAEQKASAERSAELQKSIEALVADDPQEKALYAAIQRHRSAYLKARDAVLAARKADQTERAQQLFESDFKPLVTPYLQAVDDLLKAQRDAIDRTAASIQTSYEVSRRFLILLAFGILCVSGFVAWRLSASIVAPMQIAVRAAELVADGDLRVELRQTEGDSEMAHLARAIKAMIESLKQLVGGIHSSAESISVASGQIAQGNLDLSNRTEDQAANLQRTSATMAELTEAVRHNASQLEQAGALSTQAATEAAHGGQVVSEVTRSMQGIEGSAKRIGQITAVIDGIAFQTNILALNAAVEAARAGEAGRGFAVVAGEVRTLAQRASDAAKEIRALIAESVSEVERGGALVQRAQATMVQIVASIDRVATLTREVSGSTGEQTRGIEGVNAAIQQIDSITQQNAALVEQASAAASSLSEQTERLRAEVERFRR